MARPHRQRLLVTLRMLVLVLFVLGGAAQQVFGAMGELHEFTVHADSAPGHSDHFAPHSPGEGETDSENRDTQDPAHLLLHYAHCCGHPVGLQGSEPPQLATQVTPAALPVAMTRSIVPSPAATPFRPPILA